MRNPSYFGDSWIGGLPPEASDNELSDTFTVLSPPVRQFEKFFLRLLRESPRPVFLLAAFSSSCQMRADVAEGKLDGSFSRVRIVLGVVKYV